MDNGDIFDDFALEQLAKNQFGVSLDIDKVIVRGIDVGHSAKATVFLTGKKQLYCYVYGPTKLLLSDVKKIATRMGLRPELFFPPKGRPNYFDEVGREKFKTVFPGRKDVHEADIVFYRTLAPYSPALLLIREVIDGVIYQADSDARGGWRASAKLTYRRIKTS
jgi:hypothetical protein